MITLYQFVRLLILTVSILLLILSIRVIKRKLVTIFSCALFLLSLFLIGYPVENIFGFTSIDWLCQYSQGENIEFVDERQDCAVVFLKSSPVYVEKKNDKWLIPSFWNAKEKVITYQGTAIAVCQFESQTVINVMDTKEHTVSDTLGTQFQTYENCVMQENDNAVCGVYTYAALNAPLPNEYCVSIDGNCVALN